MLLYLWIYTSFSKNIEPDQLNYIKPSLNKKETSKIKESGQSGDIFYNYNSTEKNLIISGNGNMNNYSAEDIPWISFRDEIINIYIEDGVKTIGSYAFSNCTNLKSIFIPENVTYIGDYAFQNCNNLNMISIYDKIETFGKSIFHNCSKLKTIIYGGLYQPKFEDNIFSGCEEIRNIEVLYSYENDTFLGYNITKRYSRFGKCGYYVGYKHQKEWQELIIYGDGPTINEPSGKSPFLSFRFDIQTVIFEGNITSIGNYLFDSLENFKTINLPDSIISIGAGSFISCKHLLSINIPESIISIGNHAFHYCKELQTVRYLGNCQPNIGSEIFFNSDNLITIEVPISYINETFGNMNVSKIITKKDKCGEFVNWMFIEEKKEIIIYGTGSTYNYENVNETPFYSISSKIENIIIDVPFITTIGDYLFSSLNNLKSISLLENFIYIGNYSFSNCTNLKSIYIPENFAYIGSYAFSNCTNLKSIFIPENVTYIGDFAFQNCNNLNMISIYNKLETFGKSIFHNCSKLKTIIYGGLYQPKFEDNIFSGCEEIRNIEVLYSYENDTFLGYNITKRYSRFGKCGSFVGYKHQEETQDLIIYGDGPIINSTYYQTSPFLQQSPFYSFHSKIQNVIFEGNITSIGEYTFYSCDEILSINIPESIISIGNKAFYSCRKLQTVRYLGNCQPNIGSRIFGYSDNLITIEVPISYINETFGDLNVSKIITKKDKCGEFVNWMFIEEKKEIIIYGTGSTYNYENVNETPFYSISSKIENIIIEGTFITTIGDYLFSSLNNLKSISLLGNFTYIGNYSFSNCTNLKSIYIPQNVTYIGDYAFQNCNNLNIISIYDKIETFGKSIFHNCSKLKTIIYGGLYQPKFEDNIFSGCEEIRNIEVLYSYENDTFLGYNITKRYSRFGKCGYYVGYKHQEETQELIIYGDGPTINAPSRQSPFASFCTKIQIVIFEGNITSIGSNFFFDCYLIKSVTLPNSTTSIGAYSFAHCRGLQFIHIPNEVHEIQELAFFNCKSLLSINIPEKVTSIRNFAFQNCLNLSILR
ncbi:hypothetical protein M9Y10_033157 [Tritrichomonas musculus]|uniref:Surface antigen BspA-like n=1 Tax=Tritrichomonas musculus TaxID=1915356 RepID=A0ABR2GX63_9EUKA